jgi:hypothetical protein
VNLIAQPPLRSDAEAVPDQEHPVINSGSIAPSIVEQRSLFNLPIPHHDLQSCRLDRLKFLILCVATAVFFRFDELLILKRL